MALDFSNSIALTAFIISLVALLIAMLQALQQYYSTASGYSRCAPRFIGQWSRLRHREFLVTELRFEVTFVRPRIYIGYRAKDVRLGKLESNLNNKDLRVEYTNKTIAMEELYTFQHSAKREIKPGMVTWLRLMDAISNPKGRVRTGLQQHPALEQRRSISELVREQQKISPATTSSFDLESQTGQALRNMRLGLVGGVSTPIHDEDKARKAAPPPTFDESTEYGVYVRMEPQTGEQLPDYSIGPACVISQRDISILARLLGLEWNTTLFNKNQKDGSDGNEMEEIQATGIGRALTSNSELILRYESRAVPSTFESMEVFVIHPATIPMFYGRVYTDRTLMPAKTYDQIAIDGDSNWKALLRKMFINESLMSSSSQLTGAVVPLLSVCITSTDSHAFRVPKPHRFWHDRLIQPKVCAIYCEKVKQKILNLPDSSQRNVLTEIVNAYEDLTSYPRPTAGTEADQRRFWYNCRDSRWYWPDLCKPESNESHVFFQKIHESIYAMESHICDFIDKLIKGKKNQYHEHFYFDLVSTYMEHTMSEDSERLAQDRASKPGFRFPELWRGSIKGIFDKLDRIVDDVRRRGRARILTGGGGDRDSFEEIEFLDPDQKVKGYNALDDADIEDAFLAMLFRAMCWHRAHFMDTSDKPFNPDCYDSPQDVAIV